MAERPEVAMGKREPKWMVKYCPVCEARILKSQSWALTADGTPGHLDCLLDISIDEKRVEAARKVLQSLGPQGDLADLRKAFVLMKDTIDDALEIVDRLERGRG